MQISRPNPAESDGRSAAVDPVPEQLTQFRGRDRWVWRWRVPSRSTAGASHTVVIAAGGTVGCSCPRWIYSRERCAHIAAWESETAAVDRERGEVRVEGAGGGATGGEGT